MPRYDGNTRDAPRRHHKPMHSGRKGKGHDWYLRLRKRGGDVLNSLCPFCGFPLAFLKRSREHIAGHIPPRGG